MDQDFANAARPLLEQQLSVTTELLTTLQTEYKVLKQMDSCDLTSISQQKQTLIDQLEGLSQAWLGLLLDTQAEITSEGIRAHLQAADPQETLQLLPLWQQLGEQARECQRQNQVNGAILVVRQQATQQALDILRGMPEGQPTYGPKGTSGSGVPGLSIGKA